MKVIEHLARASRPLVSVEIIPPRRGGNLQTLYAAIESILPYDPPFIDITSHSAEAIWEEQPDGSFRRKVIRKSPGTFGLCAAIKYKFNIDPVPHLLCSGFTREETEDALIELNYLGVENLLLIRGDEKFKKPIQDYRSTNRYALDLVEQVANMNQGRYLGDLIDAQPSDFCIGVAAYPETHAESPNLHFDVELLKQKQDAGAHYAVTQLFFDNTAYHRFVELARAKGVTIPIIPGLKILTKKEHLWKLPATFHTEIPVELMERVRACTTDREVLDEGIDWTYRQAVALLESGCPSIHFYIMQDTRPFLRLMERLEQVI